MDRIDSSALMFTSQQCGSAVWTLAAGRSITLKTVAPTVLKVSSGRVWATAGDGSDQTSDDLVLSAGEELALPAGQTLVIEGWPSACFEMALAALPVRRQEAAMPPLWPALKALGAWWSASARAPQRAWR
ncbi:DUF2917 domain-containing protein [Eleftheria terrae]|uniref:DUF2917 domain-containing protein n=1 Tax=Eleftheria terrae TaxID=1597781 RepID=UPI00263B88AB|nr:DUF2917 domain-containing protein [Eleftheria terrae]WKB50665.1 DUF2917 domain-containing protein [Eleftheria terrae]